MFDIIQERGCFIGFQTDDGFFVNFRHIDQKSRITGNYLTFVIVGIEAPESRHFSFQPTFPVGNLFFAVRSLIDLQIFLIFLDVHSLQLIQNRYREIPDIHGTQGWISFFQETKKNTDIICIRDSGFGRSSRFHGTEIIPAKSGKCF